MSTCEVRTHEDIERCPSNTTSIIQVGVDPDYEFPLVLPTESVMCKFKDLERVEFHDSAFNEKMFSRLAKCNKNLKVLKIDNNTDKKGTIKTMRGLGGLKKLEELSLRNQQISIIEFIGGMRNLRKLDLHGNKISTSKHSIDFSEFTKLEHLDVGDNNIIYKISTQLGGLERMKWLKYLDISGSAIGTKTPIKEQTLASFINLEELHAKKIFLSPSQTDTGIGINVIDNMKKLRVLDLSYGSTRKTSHFDDKPDELKLDVNLPRLEVLNLYYNGINSVKEIDKGRFPRLRELDLGRNKLDNIGKISEMTSLKSLNLRANVLVDMKGIEDLVNLEYLDLSHNKIENMKKLKNLKKLRELIFRNNFVKKIEGLDDLLELENLNLSSNRISEIEGLENLKKLRFLQMNNQFKRDEKHIVIKGLDNLINLKELFLEANGIENVEGLDALENLDVLDLSRNRFKEINNLQKLRNLKKLIIKYLHDVKKIDVKGLNNLEHVDIVTTSRIHDWEWMKDLNPVIFKKISVDARDRMFVIGKNKEEKMGRKLGLPYKVIGGIGASIINVSGSWINEVVGGS